jgi:(1->4)-alpha-D-glucan 1-alpha-D-glucosylmutase
MALGRGEDVIAVVPRLVLTLAAAGWEDTTLELPPGRWANLLDGAALSGRVKLAELLARFPVALLLRG